MSKESHQGHEHAKTSNENRLWWAFGLTGSYLVVQVIGGLLTHSLALLSDAAHMLTDVVGIGIAIVAVRIARRPADSQRTFGYHRFEILAAAANAVILFLVAIYIFYEAIQRFQQPEAINTWGMLAVAAVGLIVNVIGLKLLQDGSKSSLNLKGAYLEALADAVGTVVQAKGYRYCNCCLQLAGDAALTQVLQQYIATQRITHCVQRCQRALGAKMADNFRQVFAGAGVVAARQQVGLA